MKYPKFNKKRPKGYKSNKPKYPFGGETPVYPKGFDPKTGIHNLGPGEQPLTDDQLLSMGFTRFDPNTSRAAQEGDKGWYKVNPYMAPINPNITSTTKPAPKLSWPTRTDYSKGSKGPIYQSTTSYKYGGMKLPQYPNGDVFSSGYEQPINVGTNSGTFSTAEGDTYYNGQTRGDQFAKGAGYAGAAMGAYGAIQQGVQQGDTAGGINAGVDAVASQVPVYGQIYGLAKTASGIGKSLISKDETGKATTAQGAGWNEVLTPVHEQQINAITESSETGDWTDTVGNFLAPGLYSPIKEYANFKMGGKMCYPNGGMMNANAEVEKMEMMRMPNGSTMQVNGPSHEMGGVDVNIPNGTEIFSDRLKVPGSKRTFAKEAAKFKTNKEEKILSDPNSNTTSKATAKLANEIKQRKLTELFQAQEQLKHNKMQNYAKRIGMHKMPDGSMMPNSQMYPHGGEFNDYQRSGPVAIQEDNEYMFTPEELAARNYNLGDLANSSIVGQSSRPIVEFGNRQSRNYVGTPRLVSNSNLDTLPSITNEDLEARNMEGIRMTRDASIGTSPSTTTPSFNGQRKNYTEYIEPTVNTLLQNAGNIRDLVKTRGGREFDVENYGQVNPSYLNSKQALIDADIQAAITRANLREGSGGSSGVFLANQIQNATANTLNKARIREEFDNRNVGIANQFKQYNKGLEMQGKIDTAQNKARSEDIARQAIQGLGMNASSAYRDYKAGQIDKNMAGMIGSLFSNYKLDINNPTHWEWVFKTFNK